MDHWIDVEQEAFRSYAKDTVDALFGVDAGMVALAGYHLTSEIRMGNGVFILGNGGSLANALHISADLMHAGKSKRIYDPLNLAYLTAVANDENYSQIFMRYLEANALQGDTLVLLSVSKTSPNIALAAGYWRGRGDIIGLWGKRDPEGADALSDINIYVESEDPRIVETVHLAIGQAWAGMLKG